MSHVVHPNYVSVLTGKMNRSVTVCCMCLLCLLRWKEQRIVLLHVVKYRGWKLSYSSDCLYQHRSQFFWHWIQTRLYIIKYSFISLYCSVWASYKICLDINICLIVHIYKVCHYQQQSARPFLVLHSLSCGSCTIYVCRLETECLDSKCVMSVSARCCHLASPPQEDCYLSAPITTAIARTLEPSDLLLECDNWLASVQTDNLARCCCCCCIG